MRLPRNLLVGLLMAVSRVPGCNKKGPGTPEQTQRNLELEQIGELYKLYMDKHKRPPAKATDLKPLALAFQEGYRAVQDGQYVVFWGVDLSNSSKAKAVLAYEKDVPEQGGLVLLGNGTIKTMTAPEFQAAPKAKG